MAYNLKQSNPYAGLKQNTSLGMSIDPSKVSGATKLINYNPTVGSNVSSVPQIATNNPINPYMVSNITVAKPITTQQNIGKSYYSDAQGNFYDANTKAYLGPNAFKTGGYTTKVGAPIVGGPSGNNIGSGGGTTGTNYTAGAPILNVKTPTFSTLSGMNKTGDISSAANAQKNIQSTSTDYNAYITQLADAMKPTSAELTIQGELDSLANQARSGIQGTSEKQTSMGVITGEQQSIENRYLNKSQGLQDKLKTLQSARTDRINAIKSQLDYVKQARGEEQTARDYNNQLAQAGYKPYTGVDLSQVQVRSGLTTEQQNSIAELTKKPYSSWSDTDIKNWNWATGGQDITALQPPTITMINPVTGETQQYIAPPQVKNYVQLGQGEKLIDPITGNEIATGGTPEITPYQQAQLDIEQQKLSQTTNKLPTEAKNEIITMDNAVEMANNLLNIGESIGWSGTGGAVLGSIKDFAAKRFGIGSKEEISTRNLIGNITAVIAKLRGGTSFTANEQALMEKYTPTINDSPIVIKTKLENLVNQVNDKKQKTLDIYSNNVSFDEGGQFSW